MSLKGAKLVWVNKKDKSEKLIKLKNKKNFKFGYYMTNDFILENPLAKPVHCEIIADAFNRIHIVNNSKQNPILLNGFRVKTRRPLLHGSKIRIFDEEFIWSFPKNGKNKSIELSSNNEKTPEKNQIKNIPAPNSEPWKKKNKLRLKERLSAHSFVQKQELESTDESETDTKIDKVEKRKSNLRFSAKRSTLPESLKRRTLSCVTPVKEWESYSSPIKFDITMNANKENLVNNQSQSSKLTTSDTLVTSYISQKHDNHNVSSNSSFAYVKSNKNTPKSVYGTPNCDTPNTANCEHDDTDLSEDLIKFSTPKAKYSKKNASTYLIDLTTPAQPGTNLNNNEQKTPVNVNVSKSSILKSALKNANANDTNYKSTKKVKMACDYVLDNVDRSPLREESTPKRVKLSTNNNRISETLFNSIETIDETINLDDASLIIPKEIDSSIIEVSDGSISVNTPMKNSTQNNQNTPIKLNSTPQSQITSLRTPQTLIKKAILSSARKNAKNYSNRSLIVDTTSTPIRDKRLSLSFSNINNSLPETSAQTERRLPKLSLNVSTLNKTPLSNRKSLTSKSLINRTTQSGNSNKDKSFSKTPISRRKSFVNSNLSNNRTTNRPTPKRHSCENTRLTKVLMIPEIKLNRSVNFTSKNLTSLNKSTPRNLNESTIKLKSNTSGIVKDANVSNYNIGGNENSDIKIRNYKLKNNESKISQNDENSLLNETFTVELDIEENLESHQSSENFLSIADNKSFAGTNKSEVLKDMNNSKTKLDLNNSTKKQNFKDIKNELITGKDNDSTRKIKPLMRPIKNSSTPILKGIKNMMRTPKFMKTPQMEDIKHLVKTPKSEKTPNLKGIKETLKTPKPTSFNSPNLRNLRSLLKTPKNEVDNFSLLGVKELLNTPKEVNKNDFEGIKEIFGTPEIIAKNRSDNSTITPCLTFNDSFDKLIGRSSIKKTYSNKKSPIEMASIYTVELNDTDDIVKTDIQEWVENIPLQKSLTNCSTDMIKATPERLIMNVSGINVLDITNERETEQAFENFADQPKLNAHKSYTPEVRKTNVRFTRKTIGNNHVPNVSFDLQEEKERLETEQAFENFNDQPKLNAQKSYTPEIRNSKTRFVRKTIGNNQVLDVSFDLKVEKERIEIEQDFENFDDQPKLNAQKSYTPEIRNSKKRFARKTIGNNQVLNVSFDLQAEKERIEIEQDFENFDDQPKLNAQKSYTPEIRNSKTRFARKTIGNNQVLDVTFDLQAEKERLETEQVFENFDNQPKLNAQKSYTPEIRNSKTRFVRKTIGNNQVLDVSFDLKVEKERIEIEQDFENFDDQPKLNAQKSYTPEIRNSKKRFARKTIGNNQVLDVSFDLQAEKERLETEQAFENFDDQPKLNAKKSYTPEIRNSKTRFARKTIGNNQVFDVPFDLQAEKERLETEQAFVNFDDQPKLNAQKSYTPEIRNSKTRFARKTIGNNQVLDVSFDLQAEKERIELEQDFESFDDQPKLNAQKSYTPEIRNSKTIFSRKTIGNNQVLDVSFDLQAEKERLETEQAFVNFDDQPKLNAQKSYTPEIRNSKTRFARKTIGNNQVLDVSFDLQAEKKRIEIEQDFENFDDQPKLNDQKSYTPEIRNSKTRFVRKTIGNNQVLDVSFDLQAEKERLETEQAFENFDDQPKLNAQKSYTPEIRNSKTRFARKTIGNNQVLDVSFDLQAEKERIEIEQDFENFDDQPKLNVQKSYTPEIRNSKTRFARKTIGNNQVLDVSFDLQAEKERIEIEQDFENFDDQPKLNVQKSYTPEIRNSKTRFPRKTIGNNQVLDVSFDLQAEKERIEIEQDFENFDDQPKLNVQKSYTPEIRNSKTRFARKTIGNNQVLDVSFDLQTEKERLEIEQAFENFHYQPNFSSQKYSTPDLQKSKISVNRKTMGNNQVLDKSFDIKRVKDQWAMEHVLKSLSTEQLNVNTKKFCTADECKLDKNQLMNESFKLQAREPLLKREAASAFYEIENIPSLSNIKVVKSIDNVIESEKDESIEILSKRTRKNMRQKNLKSIVVTSRRTKRTYDSSVDSNIDDTRFSKVTVEEICNESRLTKSVKFLDDLEIKSINEQAVNTNNVNEKNVQCVVIDSEKSNQDVDPKSDLSKTAPKTRLRRGRKIEVKNETDRSNAVKIDRNFVKVQASVITTESMNSEKSGKNVSDSDLNPPPKNRIRRGRKVEVKNETDRSVAVKIDNSIVKIQSPVNKTDSIDSREAIKNVKSDSDLNRTPPKFQIRRGRKIEVKNEADRSKVIKIDLSIVEMQVPVITVGSESEKIDSEDSKKFADLHRTPIKSRTRQLRNTKIVDCEPEFKTPNSAAPKLRAARRLRSNSTSTPVMLVENTATLETRTDLVSSNEVVNSVKAEKENDKKIEDNTSQSDVEVETIITKPTRLKRATRKLVDSDINNISVIQGETTNKSQRKVRSKKSKVDNANINDSEDSEKFADLHRTPIKSRARQLRQPKIVDSEPEFKTPNSAVPKLRAARRLRSNSTSTPVMLVENTATLETPELVSSNEVVNSVKAEGENDKKIEDNTSQSDVKVEIIITKPTRLRRATRKRVDSGVNNISAIQDETTNKSQRNVRSKKGKVDKANINDSEASEKFADLHRTPIKSRARQLRKPKIVDSEPEFKTPNSAVPKLRAARRLRSNSTSTPVMLVENTATLEIRTDLVSSNEVVNSVKAEGEIDKKIEDNTSQSDVKVETIITKPARLRRATRKRVNSDVNNISENNDQGKNENLINQHPTKKNRGKKIVMDNSSTENNLEIQSLDEQSNDLQDEGKDNQSDTNLNNVPQKKSGRGRPRGRKAKIEPINISETEIIITEKRSTRRGK